MKLMIAALLALTLSACAGTATIKEQVAVPEPEVNKEPFHALALVATEVVPVPLISSQTFPTRDQCDEFRAEAEAQSRAYVWRKLGWKILEVQTHCEHQTPARAWFEDAQRRSHELWLKKRKEAEGPSI